MLKSKGPQAASYSCVSLRRRDFVYSLHDHPHAERLPYVPFERGAYSPTETFVGLNNFEVLFQDAKFIRSMQNTILLIVVVTIINILLCPDICRYTHQGKDKRPGLFPCNILHTKHPVHRCHLRYILCHLQA